MTDTNLVRRLTTILAIDVVAFSTMSARDEEHALALLTARMDTAGMLVRQHRGRVFKLTGDGLLAEFASPVEAVRAALEIQEAMRSANATSGPDDQLNLRIGVNLGDIVESGDDLMGDAVNVAVRLESIATTGGICISASVHEQLIGKLMLGAEDIGEQHVKNIPRPIHAYRLLTDGTKPSIPSAAQQQAAASGRRSRRVLVSAAVVALVVAAIGGTWYLRNGRTMTVDVMETVPSVPTTTVTSTPTLPPAGAAAPSPAAPTPAAPSSTADAATATAPPPTPPAPRPYAADQVPFVPDFRRRALENYAHAEGAKALALNVRGFFAVASRRIDDATARRIALEECNQAVRREITEPRDFDRCQIYAVGSDVVWSFRPPAMPPAPYIPAKPSPPIPFDPATAPLLGDPARKLLTEHYLTATRNRALVLGRGHFDWWTPGNTEAEAVRRTLQICGHMTGYPCVVLAINNDTMVRTPQSMRVIDVFMPQVLPEANDSQREALNRYLIANDWRAVAIGRNGRIGIVDGRASEAAAVADAISECARAGGTECTVSAIGPFAVTPK